MTADRQRRTAVGRGLALATGTVIVDIATKAWAEQRLDEAVEPLPAVRLDLGHNSGIAFGALNGMPRALLVLIALGVIVLLIGVVARGVIAIPRSAFALLIAGAAANLIDRVGDGRVTDFIDIAAWPSFNVADVAITAGVALIFVAALRDGRSAEPADATAQ